jgi:hypothetical protein
MSSREGTDRWLSVIDPARDLPTLGNAKRISTGYGAAPGSVQVLRDLGLPDEAIAAYFLRFNALRMND